MSLGRAVLTIGVDDSELKKGLQNTGRDLKKFGRQTTAAGKSLSIGLTAPIVGLAAAAIKLGTDFNASMANVGTLIPGNAARIQDLKKNVQDLAIETGKSTTDLAEGLFQTISAFGDSAEAAAVLGVNARAAAAGLATTTDAINLTSAVTKGYGDTSAEAVQKAADLALTTARLGQTTFPELAASMGKVIPIAQAMGVSQEELFAVFATGTGVTGSTAEVATQYRGVLAALLNPTKELSGLIEAQGFASGQAMLEQQGMVGTLRDIVAAADQSGKPITKYISSIEAVPLALALAGDQGDVFEKKLGELEKAAGATEIAFKEQTQGVNAAGFQWAQFQQSLIVAGQQLSEVLIPILMRAAESMKPLARVVRDAFEQFQSLPQPIQTGIVVLAGLVAAIGPVLLVVGTLISAFGAVLPVVAAVSGVIVAIGAGPLIAIVAAITAVVVAWRNWDVITEFAQNVYTGVKTWLVDKFQAVVDSIKGKVDAVTGFFGGMYDAVVGNSYVPDMLDAIGVQFGRLGDVMVTPSTNATLTVEGVFSSLSSGVASIVNDMLGNLGGKLDGFLNDKLGPFASAAKGILGGLIDLIPGGKVVKGIIGFGKKLFGFATGTPGLDFMPFSPMGQPIIAHGDEAVIPRGGGHQLAGEIAAGLLPHLGHDGSSSGDPELRNEVRALRRAMERQVHELRYALRDTLLQVTQ